MTVCCAGTKRFHRAGTEREKKTKVVYYLQILGEKMRQSDVCTLYMTYFSLYSEILDCRHCFNFSLRVQSENFSSGSGAIFQLPPSPAKMLGGGGREQLRNFQISRSELSSFLLFLGVRDVSSKQLKQVSIVGSCTVAIC